jgi:hypothetical protein
MSKISIINMFVGLTYWLFILSIFRFHPRKRYYRKIIESVVHKIINLICSFCFFIYGMIRIKEYKSADFFLLIPFILIVLLLFTDYLFRKKYNRTFNFVLRHDVEFDSNMLERVISALLIIIPFVSSIFIGLNMK